jgi:peptidoglycan glycosyltransferase
MSNRSKLKIKPRHRSNQWRDYQLKLKKKDAQHQSYKRLPRYAAILFALVITVFGIFKLLDKALFIPNETHSILFADKVDQFDKGVLQKIIRLVPFTKDPKNSFELSTGGNTYQIRSSIEPSLQKFIIDRVDRKNSKFFGFVAIEAETGRILSMVNYDKNNPYNDICTK